MFKKDFLIEPGKESWEALCQRAPGAMPQLEKHVQEIIDTVKSKGDEALKNYRLQYDKVPVEAAISIDVEDALRVAKPLSGPLQEAIQLAHKNISRFHEMQVQTEPRIQTSSGVYCWRKAVPIERVGLYIPGGSAPLFSTLLMLGIPARMAGCKKLIICTPPTGDGQVESSILYIASLLSVKTIYAVGGPGAIAAMAYGTDTIPAVNKIFGPGNQYVTCAKQLLAQQVVAIDMPAGPSELLVYADETAVPAFVAADLLSQAEHGPDSQVILVASNENILNEVSTALNQQLSELPRRDIAEAALEHSRFIKMSSVEKAFELINKYAPEHLLIASERAETYAAFVQHAGSVFLGNYSPEAAGDYASGTNHALPTNGFAKAFSGVSVDSFVKKISFQQINKEGIRSIGPAVELMAQAEGLFAHKNAVSIRLANLS